MTCFTGVSRVDRFHENTQDRRKSDNLITFKPFVLLAAPGSDDTLNVDGIRTMIDAVGTDRMEIELRDYTHDINLSPGERDTNLSLLHQGMDEVLLRSIPLSSFVNSQDYCEHIIDFNAYYHNCVQFKSQSKDRRIKNKNGHIFLESILSLNEMNRLIQ